jgi:hypothetical protein
MKIGMLHFRTLNSNECCFSVELVEHLAVGQFVVVVVEVQEVDTLLIVEAA